LNKFKRIYFACFKTGFCRQSQKAPRDKSKPNKGPAKLGSNSKFAKIKYRNFETSFSRR
jgi:hypothetical protein